jgi:Protein of unknown function (DUF402)
VHVRPDPEQVLFRFVWPWRVFSAIPATVVERTERRTVLWIASGTPVKWPPGIRVPISELAAGQWPHVDAEWFGSRLMIVEADASHSVYVTWGRDGEFVGWYVNLEDSWRKTSLGYDTTDHLLDIWVDPDRTWRWKDEDHLVEAVEVGLFTSEKAEAIRAEGERAIERIEAWSAPFDEGWETWTPPPGWTLPQIPDGWHRLT